MYNIYRNNSQYVTLPTRMLKMTKIMVRQMRILYTHSTSYYVLFIIVCTDVKVELVLKFTVLLLIVVIYGLYTKKINIQQVTCSF